MERVRRLLRWGPLPAEETAFSIVTGGGLLLVSLSVLPDPSAHLIHWAVWVLVVAGSVYLFLRGVWALVLGAGALARRGVQPLAGVLGLIRRVRLVVIPDETNVPADVPTISPPTSTVREWGQHGIEVTPAPTTDRPPSPVQEAMLSREVAKQAAAKLAGTDDDDVPADWTAPYYKGKHIHHCGMGDNFQTVYPEKLYDHFESHTEPWTPQQGRECYRVPMHWAKQAIHYLGDGSATWPNAPADQDNTLYVAEPFGQELAATGLYDLGPMPTQEHVLVEPGPPVVCKCGHVARNTTWFQTHLHEQGIT